MTTSVVSSTAASNVNLNEKAPPLPISASDVAVAAASKELEAAETKEEKSRRWGWRLSKKRSEKLPSTDLEKGRALRPIRLFAPVYVGLGMGLSTCAYHG